MKRFIIFILAVVVCLQVAAQDHNEAREHIKMLASPEFHGRGIAYNGETMAAEYLREQLQQYGVQPLFDEYFQPYEMPGFAMEGKVSLQIDGTELIAGTDYRILPFSQSLNGEYHIIQVKFSDLMDDNKTEKIKAKYADILGQSLLYFDVNLSKIKDEKVKKAYQSKLSQLQQKLPFNVAGILQGVDEMPAWGLNNTSKERGFAYLYILKSKVSSQANTAKVFFNNELRNFTHYNVGGIIPGKGNSEKYIVLGGHYDHLGTMGENVYFPGAHDNASGCAMVLSLAKHFSMNPCQESIVIAFFAGEESGLLGSKFFTEYSPIPLENIDYMINFDLAGGGDEGITLVNSTEGKGLEIYKVLKDFNDKEQLLSKVAQRANAANSDHYFFTQHKVPAIFVYAMGGKTGKYHDPSDTEENCSLSKFDAIQKLFVTFITQ